MNADTTSQSPRRRPSTAAILLIPIFAAIALAIFAWPMANVEPRDLPVAVAGPPGAATELEHRLTAVADFDIERYADASAARAAIEDRDVYGAYVAAPDGGMTLMTASAASPRVAQSLSHAAQAAHPSGPVHVEDVVPVSTEGMALPTAVFPLLLAGTLTAALSAMLAVGALRRTGLVVGSALLVGLVANAVVQSWLGIVEGDWWVNAGVLSLMVLAISAFVAGLDALWGRAGYLVGVAAMVFIANPWSGNSSAPELLPEPVGLIGQLMPVGAGGNLLRSTGFFDGAGAGGHVLVLATWATVGLTAMLLAGLRGRQVSTAPAPQPA